MYGDALPRVAIQGYKRKQKQRDDSEETGSECDEDASQSDDASSRLSESSADHDEDNSEEANAFKRKPLDPSRDLNADGTAKFIPKSKLMLKLDEIDPDAECSDDAVDNSFGE